MFFSLAAAGFFLSPGFTIIKFCPSGSSCFLFQCCFGPTFLFSLKGASCLLWRPSQSPVGWRIMNIQCLHPLHWVPQHASQGPPVLYVSRGSALQPWCVLLPPELLSNGENSKEQEWRKKKMRTVALVLREVFEFFLPLRSVIVHLCASCLRIQSFSADVRVTI